MKKYRNEWKYICSNYDLELLKNRIINILNIDENAKENQKYCIHSLYFDTFKNRCIRENEAGDYKRYKWRIRYYNDSSDKLFLEKKEKLFGRCHKKKCKLSLKEYQNILSGNYMEVFWQTDDKLLKQFIVDVINKGFRPKVIIEYERYAFIEEILNIRITLDTNISASYDINEFLTGNYILEPVQEKDTHVLEVKFDYILPSYVKNIVCSNKFVRTSFSKYYLGMKRISGGI